MAFGRKMKRPFPVSKQPFTGSRPRRPGISVPRRPGPGIAPPPSGLQGRRIPNPFRKKGSGGSRNMRTPSMGRVLRGKNNY